MVYNHIAEVSHLKTWGKYRGRSKINTRKQVGLKLVTKDQADYDQYIIIKQSDCEFYNPLYLEARFVSATWEGENVGGFEFYFGTIF